MNLCFNKSFAVGRYPSAKLQAHVRASLQLLDHVEHIVARNLETLGRTWYRQVEGVGFWE